MYINIVNEFLKKMSSQLIEYPFTSRGEKKRSKTRTRTKNIKPKKLLTRVSALLAQIKQEAIHENYLKKIRAKLIHFIKTI